MTQFKNIAIKVLESPEENRLSGNADALLHEIAALLDGLIKHGRCGAIDLHNLPLTAADLRYLRERLGRGEVQAEVHALGRSEIVETAYRGVWWITHRNLGDELGAELIEVTLLPAILASDCNEMTESLARLRASLEPAPRALPGQA